MADNKMDIDPSGDSDRADLSDPAASFILSNQIQRNLKKDRTDSLREIHAFGEVSWLLHIISAQVFWEQGVLKTKICLLGIPLEKFKNLFRKKRNQELFPTPEIKMQKNRQRLLEVMKRHQKAKIRTIPQSCKCLSLRKILLKI